MSYQASDTTQMIYVGTRQGSFEVMSGITRTRYLIPGSGGFVELGDTAKQGVLKQDVPWFRSVNQGRDFKVVEPPAQPAAVAAVAPPEPLPAPSPAESVAWRESIMEEPEIAETIESAPEINVPPLRDLWPMPGLDIPDIEALEIPDVGEMTTRDVRDYAWTPEQAEVALKAERDSDEPRKTILKHLERIVDAA